MNANIIFREFVLLMFFFSFHSGLIYFELIFIEKHFNLLRNCQLVFINQLN